VSGLKDITELNPVELAELTGSGPVDARTEALCQQKVSFILDLFDVCHQLFLEGSTFERFVVVRRQDWTKFSYANRPANKIASDRAWERWKKKIRKLGVSEGEHLDDDQGVALLIDPEFVRRATDKALGIDESHSLE
jgi:hypothetical protein